MASEPAIRRILEELAANAPQRFGDPVPPKPASFSVKDGFLWMVYYAVKVRRRGWLESKSAEKDVAKAVRVARKGGWSQEEIDAAIAVAEEEVGV